MTNDPLSDLCEIFFKWSILMRLSSWSNLKLRRWILCCWGCQDGTCKWISRYFLQRIIKKFSFFPMLWRHYLTCLEVEKLGIRWWLNRLTKLFLHFSEGLFRYLLFCPVSNNEWAHFNEKTMFQPLGITMLAIILENVSKKPTF